MAAARDILWSKGWETRLLNGQINVITGELTGARAGKVLRLAS